jgi:hypothetical protein
VAAVTSRKGAKVLCHIFNPYSPEIFSKQELDILKLEVPHKKDIDQRRTDILKHVWSPVLVAVAGELRNILKNSNLGLLLTEILRFAEGRAERSGDIKGLTGELGGLILDSEIADGNASHRTYRRLLNISKQLRKTASKALRKATPDQITSLLQTKGVWVLVTLITKRKKLGSLITPYRDQIQPSLKGGAELVKLL